MFGESRILFKYIYGFDVDLIKNLVTQSVAKSIL